MFTPGSEESLMRQELLWQQRILEKDKMIHEREKAVQAMNNELQERKMRAAQDAEAQRQMT